MKKLTFAVVLLAIGMLIQGVNDRRAFHKRSVGVARYSYQTGCLAEGVNDCFDNITGGGDESVIMRGHCFDLVFVECEDRAKGFEDAFDKGPK